ncbi:GTP-binding protein HSR1-related [Ignisphaera aggregans DSM 17230]|uniref:GTP-binding protein HSR1-related n=1 Tax=Ignisphaera aggregans (strain DSM 17230 / JCM 13409 / AQ1.S1) TaxID=583356 RepID=E0SPL6_IGNAA|nr:GTP-binding protein HSR1-related [Ignisphaera aggregans DSM 17230]
MKFLSLYEVSQIINRCDAIIEVVEARNPISLIDTRIEKIAKRMGKEIILVLSKSDLVPRNICLEWQEYFRDRGIVAICFSTVIKSSISRFKRFLVEHIEKRPAYYLLIGYPKVGKSSIINALKGYKSAPTSPYPGSPGYTKGVQLYLITPGIYIIDTPGVLPPITNDIEVTIRRQPIEMIENPVKIAITLIERILSFDVNTFRNIYRVHSTEPIEILRELAYKKGWLMKKYREPNIDEVARNIIRDYLNGKIPFYTSPRSILDDVKVFKPK